MVLTRISLSRGAASGASVTPAVGAIVVRAVSVRMNGLIGFPAGVSTVVTVTTFVAGHFFNVLNPHATGKKSHRDEETDDQNGDQHQDPCDGFKSAETEGLENSGAEETHGAPPCYGTKGAKKEMV